MILKNREVNDRVRASVNPTTEILQSLCLKLLRVQGNRIIAKRARDSSGRIPLYKMSTHLGDLSFSVFEILEELKG